MSGFLSAVASTKLEGGVGAKAVGRTAGQRHQPFVRCEQAANVLPRFERAEKQDVPIRWRRRPRRPVRCARGTDRDAFGGDAELPLHFDRGEPRGHDDPRRAVRVIAHEIGIIPPDFRTGPLRMREEIEIVNRNHLGGVARRQEQRMQGVGDVEIEARELLDPRPAEAVPGEVEQANRHPPIDGVRAAKVGRVGEAIFPGAGKDRQSEGAVGPRSRIRFEQRLDELMRILADAAPRAQRRPIVDQDAHLFKSFRLSIVL